MIDFRAIFDRSAHAMLLADDDRRYVDGNAAACRLLDVSREALRQMRVDDFLPPGADVDVDELWRAFVTEGAQAGYIELVDTRGRRIAVDYSATANVEPGLHLSLLLPREAEEGSPPEPTEVEAPAGVLTPREREVLGRLAMGATGSEIASELYLSTETVRTHVQNARDKLGARTRAHAIVLAIRGGELEVPL